MKNYLSLLLLGASALVAQTSEVHYFLADMRGANEVPAVTTTNSAGALVIAHVVRDAQGQVVSGTVEFNLRATFAAAETITGLHIHTGAAGANGPVVIDTGIRGTDQLQSGVGVVRLQYSGQVRTAGAGLDALRGMLTNPNGYYVNLHTMTNPGGQFRGQLYRAEERTFLSDLNSANEVPPVETPARGVGAFVALRAYDSAGRFVLGGGLFTASYGLGGQRRLTGWHLHRGAAGANGPVVLDSGLAAAEQVDTPESGNGTIQRWITYQPEAAAAVAALGDIFNNPGGFYMNLHTTTNPGGMIRGQMIPGERVGMSLRMSPENEVPAITGLDATGVATVWGDVARDGAGMVTHAFLNFSVNYRFPGETTFTGLHIHVGEAGANGPVRLDSGITGANNVRSADGFGNISRSFVAATEAGLMAMNGLLANPEGYYLNLHTTVNPGGAVRGQLAAARTSRPTVLDVISGVSDPSLKNAAMGGLMTAFGQDLFKVPANPQAIPSLAAQLNGTSVTVGGVDARIWMMGNTGGNPPEYLVFQVPFNAPAGPQDVVVTNSNGAGAAFRTTVTPVAPALFFDGVGGIALHADFTLVRPESPAVTGETIGLLSTGLGQTNPALATGQFAGTGANVAQAVTATMGGRPALVVAAQALPGYAGVYFVAVMVPAEVTGNVMTQIRSGEVASNMVAIQVR